MPVTYKRQDDLEKMLGEFASFDHLISASSEEQTEKTKNDQSDD